MYLIEIKLHYFSKFRISVQLKTTCCAFLVATRGSVLYFLIVEMSMVNIMYQTSLRQFLGLFDISMARSQKSPVTSKRIHNIIEYLTFEVYRYTCRGLYEQDKFLFTILTTLKIELQAGKIRPEEFQVFIKGLYELYAFNYCFNLTQSVVWDHKTSLLLGSTT